MGDVLRAMWMERRRPVVAATIVVTVIVIVAVLALPPTEDDAPGDAREYYTGDYHDYYIPYGLGANYTVGCTAGPINEVLDPTDLEMPDRLPIYALRPPTLATREQAAEYLAGFNYNVTGWGYRWEDSTWPCHVFSFYRQTSIAVLVDGAVEVNNAASYPEPRRSNITTEEAENAALSYLENHTGIPDFERMEVSHDNAADSRGNKWIEHFTIYLYRSVGGYPMDGGPSHILIRLNANTGKVMDLQYRWTEVVRTDTIESEELGDLEDIVSDYITAHNARYGGGMYKEVSNVTSVDIVLRPPFDTSSMDMYEGSPSYVYLPFVRITYGNGNLAYMSPLAGGIVG